MTARKVMALLLSCIVQLTSYTCANATTQDIFYYFAHGLRGNAQRYFRPYFKGFFLKDRSILAANGPDYLEESISESISLKKINAFSLGTRILARIRREFVLLCAVRRAAMAQQEDQNRVLECISQDKRATDQCIYIGHSKGAALGANLLQKYVFKGAILIAPFCDANKAFRDFPPLSSLAHNSVIDDYIVPFLRYCLLPNYDSSGQQPLHFETTSPNVARQTPILIISIKNDQWVPQYHQMELYIKLKETGHNVFFYEMQSGDHDTLAADPDNHQHQKFIAVIQAFQSYIETGIHPFDPNATQNWYWSPTPQELLTYFGLRS